VLLFGSLLLPTRSNQTPSLSHTTRLVIHTPPLPLFPPSLPTPSTRQIADIFVQCAKRPADSATVYTVGGDTVNTAGFVDVLESVLPGSKALITVTGGNIPIASRLDDHALRTAFPGLKRVSLQDGVAATVEVYKKMAEKGTLVV
jgi:hypothetical protein